LGDAETFTFLRPAYDYVTPHIHKHMELLYVMEGKLFVEVDEVAETLTEGDFLLTLPYQVHMLKNDETPSRVWIGVFPEQYVQEFASFMEDKKGRSPKFNCDEQVVAFFKAYLLDNKILTTDMAEPPLWPAPKLNEKTQGMEPAEKMRHIYAMKAALYAICTCYAGQVELIPREHTDKSLTYTLLKYILEHFKENITLKRMAEDLGYNYSYLSSCQQQILGMSFNDFVNQYRVEFAHWLMRTESDMKLSDVAAKSGFGSVRNFNDVFKRVTGKTPSEAMNR